MYIYLVQNQINGKMYVGQTIGNVKYRWSDHKCPSEKKHKSYLRNAIRKHGPDCFIVSTTDTATSISELNAKEIYWIKKLNTIAPCGYNLEHGGKNSKASDVARARMSMAQKARFRDPIQRANLRNLGLAYAGQTRASAFVGGWTSQRLCADDLGVQYQNLNKALKGLRRAANGYTFSYS